MSKHLSDADFFLSIPWCREILEDPSISYSTIHARSFKNDHEDTFFARTLKSRGTINACLVYWKTPPHSPQVSDLSTSWPNGNPLADEVHILAAIGSDVNGYTGISHGGFVATLLDEVTGVLLQTNQALSTRGEAGHSGHMTVYLNVTYRKPLKTPQVLRATARFKKVEGRKKFINSWIRSQDGTVLASAEALLVKTQAVKI